MEGLLLVEDVPGRKRRYSGLPMEKWRRKRRSLFRRKARSSSEWGRWSF